jgi:hypothetical protein
MDKWFHRIPFCTRDKILVDLRLIDELLVYFELLARILSEDTLPCMPTLSVSEEWYHELISFVEFFEYLVATKWCTSDIASTDELVDFVLNFLRMIEAYCLPYVHECGCILLVVMEEIEDVSLFGIEGFHKRGVSYEL